MHDSFVFDLDPGPGADILTCAKIAFILVNWKTGGVVKSVATIGIVKGDVNGRLRNGRSRLGIPKPIRLLVYTPEGTQIPST